MPMIEELWPLNWSSFRGWFSPTALFLFLNLVIGIIALTSRSVRSHRRHPSSGDDIQREELPPLPRGPSAVLERLRSFGLSRFHSGEIPLVDAPLPEADLPEAPAVPKEAKRDHKNGPYGRSASDSGEEAVGKLAGRMKKSASASSAFDHLEADEIVRRVATARGGRHAVVAEEEEEEAEEMVEVNARADDFISRFRQQLTLQRHDSILRYKEMLNRSR